jgi:hypothetical protein
MKQYNENYNEFLEIIHNGELLSKHLNLKTSEQNGKPAITYDWSFFTNRCQEGMFLAYMLEFLNATYQNYVYLIETENIPEENRINLWTSLFSRICEENGVRRNV